MDTIVLQNLVKFYPPDRRALSTVNLSLKEGEFTAILGGPGSGKTTLMRILCGLTHPSSGSVSVLGKQLFDMGEKQRADFRNSHIGVVLRKDVFFEGLSVAENTALPLIAGGTDEKTAIGKAKEMLRAVGLEKRGASPVGALRTTDRHLVQLARALVRRPEILLLDEPGGDLHGKEKEKLFENIQILAGTGQCTMICFTAEGYLAERFNRIVHLQDGEIVKE